MINNSTVDCIPDLCLEEMLRLDLQSEKGVLLEKISIINPLVELERGQSTNNVFSCDKGRSSSNRM